MSPKWIGKSKDGSCVNLYNIDNCKIKIPAYVNEKWLNENENLIRNGIVVDVETTGLNFHMDNIIEIGLRQFKFNRLTGEILQIGNSYSAFQDPEVPLSEEIKKLTGITDDMLKNQKINWSYVEEIFSQSHIIIAHNAAFDRPFIDKQLQISSDKIWGCSLKQINWLEKGFTIHKLEILGIFHGFFIENAHRALNDADALLYLISLQDENTNSPYIKEILTNARRLTVSVKTTSAPFESKDLLKKRGYFWDSSNRVWVKSVFKDEIEEEVSWLEKDVYKGFFAGSTQEIKLTDSFKSN